MKETFEIAMGVIRSERQRQDYKFGDPNHTPPDWLVILMEEIGEISRAILKGDKSAYRNEVVQAAAVLVAMYEQELIEVIDREESESPAPE